MLCGVLGFAGSVKPDESVFPDSGMPRPSEVGGLVDDVGGKFSSSLSLGIDMMVIRRCFLDWLVLGNGFCVRGEAVGELSCVLFSNVK